MVGGPYISGTTLQGLSVKVKGVYYLVGEIVYGEMVIDPGMLAAIGGIVDPANSYEPGEATHYWLSALETKLRKIEELERWKRAKEAQMAQPRRSKHYRNVEERLEEVRRELGELGLTKDQIDLAGRLDTLGIAERVEAVQIVMPKA